MMTLDKMASKVLPAGARFSMCLCRQMPVFARETVGGIGVISRNITAPFVVGGSHLQQRKAAINIGPFGVWAIMGGVVHCLPL